MPAAYCCISFSSLSGKNLWNDISEAFKNISHLKLKGSKSDLWMNLGRNDIMGFRQGRYNLSDSKNQGRYAEVMNSSFYCSLNKPYTESWSSGGHTLPFWNPDCIPKKSILFWFQETGLFLCIKSISLSLAPPNFCHFQVFTGWPYNIL